MIDVFFYMSAALLALAFFLELVCLYKQAEWLMSPRGWPHWIPEWMKPKPQNEYRPWEAEGITELDYWKDRYTEVSRKSESIVEASVEQRAIVQAWKAACEKAQIEADVLRAEQVDAMEMLGPEFSGLGLVDACEEVKRGETSNSAIVDALLDEIDLLRSRRRIVLGRGEITVGRTHAEDVEGLDLSRPNNLVIIQDAQGEGYTAGDPVPGGPSPACPDKLIAWFEVEGAEGVRVLTDALQEAATAYQTFLESTQQVTLAAGEDDA